MDQDAKESRPGRPSRPLSPHEESPSVNWHLPLRWGRATSFAGPAPTFHQSPPPEFKKPATPPRLTLPPKPSASPSAQASAEVPASLPNRMQLSQAQRTADLSCIQEHLDVEAGFSRRKHLSTYQQCLLFLCYRARAPKLQQMDRFIRFWDHKGERLALHRLRDSLSQRSAHEQHSQALQWIDGAVMARDIPTELLNSALYMQSYESSRRYLRLIGLHEGHPTQSSKQVSFLEQGADGDRQVSGIAMQFGAKTIRVATDAGLGGHGSADDDRDDQQIVHQLFSGLEKSLLPKPDRTRASTLVLLVLNRSELDECPELSARLRGQADPEHVAIIEYANNAASLDQPISMYDPEIGWISKGRALSPDEFARLIGAYLRFRMPQYFGRYGMTSAYQMHTVR